MSIGTAAILAVSCIEGWTNHDKMLEYKAPSTKMGHSLPTRNARSQQRSKIITVNRNETTEWIRLFVEAREVVKFMQRDEFLNGSQRLSLVKTETYVIIHTSEIPWVARGFEQCVVSLGIPTNVVQWELGVSCQRREILSILKASLEMETKARSVVVVSSYVGCIRRVLNTAASESVFKWRRFLHATEWFAMTIDPDLVGVSSEILGTNDGLPDFVTSLSINTADGNVFLRILQKSRTQPMRLVLRVDLFNESSLVRGDLNPWSFLYVALPNLPQQSLNQTFLKSSQLRQDAVNFLASQKSVMAGMRIPIVLFPTRDEKSVYRVSEGNSSSWAGFYVAVLDLLSETLGFKAVPFPVSDGGFYGAFNNNGDLLGAAGKQAGLLCLSVCLSLSPSLSVSLSFSISPPSLSLTVCLSVFLFPPLFSLSFLSLPL